MSQETHAERIYIGLWDITPRPKGVANPFSGFSRIAKERRRWTPEFFCHLVWHPFLTFPEYSVPRSSQVRSTGQVKWPYLMRSLCCYSGYSFWKINMKSQDIKRLPVPTKQTSRLFRLWWPDDKSVFYLSIIRQKNLLRASDTLSLPWRIFRALLMIHVHNSTDDIHSWW